MQNNQQNNPQDDRNDAGNTGARTDGDTRRLQEDAGRKAVHADSETRGDREGAAGDDRNDRQTQDHGAQDHGAQDRGAQDRGAQDRQDHDAQGAGNGQRQNRGFAAMDETKQRDASRRGGQNVPDEKRSFSQNHELAADAGRKGGQASGGNFANDPARAAEAGRKGGEASASRNAAGRTVEPHPADREAADSSGHRHMDRPEEDSRPEPGAMDAAMRDERKDRPEATARRPGGDHR